MINVVAHVQQYGMYPRFRAPLAYPPTATLLSTTMPVHQATVGSSTLPPSRMWRILELVLMILAFLVRRDQAAMAAVSWRFWQIATPLVWASISVFDRDTHLLHVIPPTLKTYLVGERFDLPRDKVKALLPLLSGTSVWDRFNIHAPLIKGFHLDASPAGQNLFGLVRALHHLNVLPIFPNLKSLSITTYRPRPILDLIPSVLCPTIRVLQVQVQEPVDMTTLELLRATQQLKLHGLDVQSYSPDRDIATAVSEAISAQTNLKRLHVYDVPGRLQQPWLAASRLPHLEEVHFFDSNPYNYPLDTPFIDYPMKTSGGFPSLRRAKLDGTAMTLPVALAAFTTTTLEVLQIVVHAPDASEVDLSFDIGGVMREAYRFTSLKSFQLTFPTAKATWEHLSPLLACRGMEKISLFGYRLSQIIRDTELLLMAEAWPELEVMIIDDFIRREEFKERRPRLVLDPEYQRAPPGVTLSGIQGLVGRLPKLRRLGIAVDARNPPDDAASSDVGHAVKSVLLPHSWTDRPTADAVVAFICRVFPNQTLPAEATRLDWIRGHYLNSWRTAWKGPSLDVDGEDGPWPAIWDQVYRKLASRRTV